MRCTLGPKAMLSYMDMGRGKGRCDRKPTFFLNARMSGVLVIGIDAVYKDITAHLHLVIKVQQPVHAFEEGRLAASRRTYDSGDLAVRDIHGDVLKHFVVPVCNGKFVEADMGHVYLPYDIFGKAASEKAGQDADDKNDEKQNKRRGISAFLNLRARRADLEKDRKGQ